MDSGSQLSPRAPSDPTRIGVSGMVSLIAAGTLLAAAAAVVALTGDMPHEVSLAERQALLVATPIAVGVYAWRDGLHARFGRLLVIAGFASFLATLAGSGNDVLYSVGRVAGWCVEAGIVYLVLAFPSGRLTSRLDRWLVTIAVVVVATLYLPTAMFTESYPAPSQFATCDAGCPANAFMVAGSEPALIDDVVRPLREVITVIVFLVVVVRLADRIRRATRLMRRTLVPVLAFAIFRTLAVAVAIPLRAAGADAAIAAVTSVIALGLPAMCIGFLLGMLRWRIYTADCLVALAHGLRTRRTAAERRDLIAATLTDPTVELAFWRGGDEGGGGWIDVDRRPISLPHPPSDRQATLVLDDGSPVAAVIHDAALSEQRSFVEAVGAYAFVWDDNRRLAARVESSLTELRASRARILAAADEERRRIERDLHDGGQQRLVALRIRLELAEELMDQDPAQARAVLHRLGSEVDAALDELRALAAGVYPAVLAARGLSEAIRSAALQSPVPATVKIDGVDRYSREAETAAYFCCIEALQNVAKHAPEATRVSISLSRNGDLRFEVNDNGPGFPLDDAADGHGLVNMRDRMAAVGGELEIRSRPGAGTEVVGTIPVA
jgi:signal transduction histidine kinase